MSLIKMKIFFKGVFRVRRTAAALIFAVLLSLLLGSALAQTVSCPVGGFSFTLPDHFREHPLSRDDPDLCLYWSGKKMSVLAYATYLGEVAGSDLFQVLTGTETDVGNTTKNGMNMIYATGADGETAYLMYSWMDRGNNVTLYFYYPAGDDSCLDSANRIMNSISFDAGH
jgi:hypothetical protein